MEKSSKICITWLVLLSIVFAICLILGFGVLQDWTTTMHIYEERQLNNDVSNLFCQSLKVTSTQPADIIQYNGYPSISSKPQIHYGFRNDSLLNPNSATYLQYYLLAGSNMTILAKVTGHDVTLRVYYDSMSNSPELEKYVIGCLGGYFCSYDTYNFTITKTGPYYVYFLNSDDAYGLIGTSGVSVGVVINRTIYLPPQTANPVRQQCLEAKECTVDMPTSNSFLLYKSGNGTHDGSDHPAKVTISCKLRIWMLFLVVALPCILLAGLLTVALLVIKWDRFAASQTPVDGGIWSRIVTPRGDRVNLVLFEEQPKPN